MRVIRFNTALGLLLTGVLLITAQFGMLSHALLTHPGLAETAPTSGGTQNTQVAPCHGESAPNNQTPKNHDCCTVGHLHAIGSAQASVAPAFAATLVNRTLLPSATIVLPASHISEFPDTGPPGSAVPIRI